MAIAIEEGRCKIVMCNIAVFNSLQCYANFIAPYSLQVFDIYTISYSFFGLNLFLAQATALQKYFALAWHA